MKYKLIFFSLFLSITIFGQSIAEGQIYYDKKQYAKARNVYDVLLKKRPTDALVNFKYARCSYELKDYELAIDHFLKAGKKYPERYYYLGDAYFITYRFEESLLAYQTYIATLKADDSKIQELQKTILKVQRASKYLNKVEDIAIVDSVVVNKSDFLRFYKFSSELGSLNQSLENLTLNKTFDKITYITQRKDRIYYSDATHSQVDIFTSFKLFDAWSDSVSVSEVINTSANENYPFLLLDGVTLYFASDGENSMGGYDLFVTRFTRATDTFLAPENIGFPFNSPANDYMMVIDEQRKLGWFATDRGQAAGKVIIYNFVVNDSKLIIRSESKDTLRAFAQLKMHRKSVQLKPDNTIEDQVKLQKTDMHIDFVINDTVIYTHLSDFKSEDAAKLWATMEMLSLNLNNLNVQLDTLRLEYGLAATLETKQSLSTKIIELESQHIEIENMLLQTRLQFRNAENIFLQKEK